MSGTPPAAPPATSTPTVRKYVTKADMEKKKEALRIKREKEAKRREEEAARREKENEAAERAGMARAESEAVRRQEVRRREAEATKRLAAETAEREAAAPAAAARLSRWLERKNGTAEWTKYSTKEDSYDAADEAEVNTFLSQWSDEWVSHKRPTLSRALQLAGTCCGIIAELEQRAADADQRAAANSMMPCDAGSSTVSLVASVCASKFRERAESLKAFLLARLDETTADLVHHADMYMPGDSEICLLQDGNEHVGLGVWVTFGIGAGTVGNPGAVRFTKLGMGTDLPTHFAIKGTALRMMQTSFLVHSSSAWRGKWVPLGPEIAYDMVALPAVPKKVKLWTMRQVTQQSKTLAKVPYGPSAQALVEQQDKDKQPLGEEDAKLMLPIHFRVPATVFLRGDVTVGWYKLETDSWETTGIANLRFDRATREVRFLSALSGSFAVLQDASLDVPFLSWELSPSTEDGDRVRLSLETRAHLKVVVEVVGDCCSLVEPSFPELAHLHRAKLPAAHFLRTLARSGIKLFLGDGEVALPARESRAYQQISMVACSASIRSNSLNDRLPDAADAAVVQVAVPGWKSARVALIHSTGCTLVETGGGDTSEFHGEVLAGRENHVDMAACMATDPDTSVALRKSLTKLSDLHFARELTTLLSITRPLARSPPSK